MLEKRGRKEGHKQHGNNPRIAEGDGIGLNGLERITHKVPRVRSQPDGY